MDVANKQILRRSMRNEKKGRGNVSGNTSGNISRGITKIFAEAYPETFFRFARAKILCNSNFSINSKVLLSSIIYDGHHCE